MHNKKRKKQQIQQIKNNKKDSFGLFSGRYKSQEIESKKFKKKNQKKNLKLDIDE